MCLARCGSTTSRVSAPYSSHRFSPSRVQSVTFARPPALKRAAANVPSSGCSRSVLLHMANQHGCAQVRRALRPCRHAAPASALLPETTSSTCIKAFPRPVRSLLVSWPHSNFTLLPTLLVLSEQASTFTLHNSLRPHTLITTLVPATHHRFIFSNNT